MAQHDDHTVLTFMGQNWRIAKIDWRNGGPLFRLRNCNPECHISVETVSMCGANVDWDAYCLAATSDAWMRR